MVRTIAQLQQQVAELRQQAPWYGKATAIAVLEAQIAFIQAAQRCTPIMQQAVRSLSRNDASHAVKHGSAGDIGGGVVNVSTPDWRPSGSRQSLGFTPPTSLWIIALLLTIASAAYAQPAPAVDFNLGGVIDLPEGIIEVSQSFRPNPGRGLILTGKGTKPTHIRLTADLGGAPLFDCSGKLVPILDDAGAPVLTPDGKPMARMVPFANLEIRNVTIETDSQQQAEAAGVKNDIPFRRNANAFNLSYVVESRFDRVKILGFAGHGIYAYCLWDTVFTDVQIARCGSAPVDAVLDEFGVVQVLPIPGRAALHLADGGLVREVVQSAKLPLWATSNNNHFFGCRFENGPFVLTHLGLNASKNQFIACKWHGELHRDTPSKSSPYSHVVIAGYGNTLQACNLVRSGADAVVIEATAHGTIVEACTIQTNDGAGIRKHKKARKCQVDRNVFADWEPGNRGGDLREQ